MRKFLLMLTLLASVTLIGCESDEEKNQKAVDEANVLIRELNIMGSDLLYTHGVNVGDDQSVLPMSLDTMDEVNTVEGKLKKYIAKATHVIGISNREGVEAKGRGRFIRYRDNARRLLAQINGARQLAQRNERANNNPGVTESGNPPASNYEVVKAEFIEIAGDLKAINNDLQAYGVSVLELASVGVLQMEMNSEDAIQNMNETDRAEVKKLLNAYLTLSIDRAIKAVDLVSAGGVEHLAESSEMADKADAAYGQTGGAGRAHQYLDIIQALESQNAGNF
jgi:hypothetical protein